ncbi:hypothetical protein KCU65_g9801, partial [Aureobasidium melanogenum]
MHATLVSILFTGLALPFASAWDYPSAKESYKGFNCPSTTCAIANTAQIRAAMQSFAAEFYIKKHVPTAFNTFVAENYIQHNAGILSGRQNAIEALQPLFSSTSNTFDVKRLTVGQDGADETMVIIHLEASNTSGNTTSKTDVVDMYRLVGTCIVEHWDVLQAETASINPLAYF